MGPDASRMNDRAPTHVSRPERGRREHTTRSNFSGHAPRSLSAFRTPTCLRRSKRGAAVLAYAARTLDRHTYQPAPRGPPRYDTLLARALHAMQQPCESPRTPSQVCVVIHRLNRWSASANRAVEYSVGSRLTCPQYVKWRLTC